MNELQIVTNELHQLEKLDMLDAVNSLVLIFDQNDRIVYANEACCYTTGYSREEMINTRVEDFLLLQGEEHHGYLSLLEHQHNQCLNIYTNKWTTSDGSARIISWVNRPLSNTEGEITHVLATGNDITELQMGEEQIMLNAEQQEILNNLLHIGMEDISLQEKLAVSLQKLMAASWVGHQAEAAIFMIDNQNEPPRLITDHAIQHANRTRMSNDEFSRALCKPCFQTSHVQFIEADSPLNPGSDKPFYCVPVKDGGEVLAVIILFLESWHLQDLGEMVFLNTVTNSIASVITRHKINAHLKMTQDNLKAAQRIAEMGSWELNTNTHMMFLSDEAINILQLESRANPIALESFYKLIHGDDVTSVIHNIENALSDGSEIESTFRTQSKSEQPLTLIIKGEVHSDDDTSNRKLIGTIQDISKKLLAEQQQQLISNVFEGAHESIVVLDTSCRIMRINDAFSTITGYKESQVSGKYIDILNSSHEDQKVYNEMWTTVENHGSWCGELISRKSDGEVFSEWRTISTVRNSQDEIECYLVLSMDLSQIKQSEERIHQLVYYDALTQLPNRSMFKTVLSDTISVAEHEHQVLGVLSLGLDGLVRINDSLGHSSGDKVLTIMADRLRHCVRSIDTVCRWGGDEFLVLLADIKQVENAVAVASKILNTLIEPVKLDEGESIVIGASMGISMYPQHSQDTMSLIQNADVAMHKAKTEGGNCFNIFSSEMNVDVIERLSIESGLRNALEEQQFELHYQPIVQLADNRIINAESLIRWRHPKKGLIPPMQFIPVAEESGLIVPIGEWVLREACAQCARWQRNGHPDVGVSINLSPRQFYDKHLLQAVTETLRDTGVNPASITLEITESSIMDSVNETVEYLHRLKDTGVQLSIDDFGTGYSSLAYLKRFPIDKLKIDQSFIRDVDINPDDRAIVQTVIAMGHNMNLGIVAEGVEKVEHLQYLLSQKCEMIQGYFISKPVPIAEFLPFINKHNTSQTASKNDPAAQIHIL